MGAFTDLAGVVARGAAPAGPGDARAGPDGRVGAGGRARRARPARPTLDALRGYAEGGADGIGAWVRHCAQAVVLGAREGVAVCEAIQRGA